MLLEIMFVFKGKKFMRKHVLCCISSTQTNQSKFKQKRFEFFLSNPFSDYKHYISETTFISNTVSVN